MKKAFLLLIIIMLFIFPSQLCAAWWIEKYFGDGNKKEITDDVYNFRLDDISCIVGQTDFYDYQHTLHVW